MNAKELKELGIVDDDLISKIIVSHGKGIEKYKNDVEALTASKAEIEAKKADLEAQLAQNLEQLKKFQEMKPEELQKAITELQTKYERAQAEGKQALEKVKYDTAIENALRDAKARNLKAARAVLDEAELKLGEDGTIAGLKERVDKVAAENAFLFGSEVPPKIIPKVVAKTTNQPPTPEDPVVAQLRRGAGLPVAKL
jgi:dsDNA-specific endonuclease/ATPase MutS2